jgi:hypothetical protein
MIKIDRLGDNISRRGGAAISTIQVKSDPSLIALMRMQPLQATDG